MENNRNTETIVHTEILADHEMWLLQENLLAIQIFLQIFHFQSMDFMVSRINTRKFHNVQSPEFYSGDWSLLVLANFYTQLQCIFDNVLTLMHLYVIIRIV